MRIDHYVQGQACWVELASHDAVAGKQFYAGLFGWETQDMQTPEGIYTMFGLTAESGQGQDDIGAAYQMPQDQLEQGIPSSWSVYFAVDCVEETLDKVISEGGTLLMGPCDVGTAGKTAVFTDTEGAQFSVWQAGDHIGAHRSYEHGTVCWVELASLDPQSAKAFYPGVLQWGAKTAEVGGNEYTEWLVAGQPIGGMLQMNEEWGDIPPHWMLYFSVDDSDAAALKATQLGGKVCVPPTDIAGVGRFAVINDPQGGFFSVITLFTQSSN